MSLKTTLDFKLGNQNGIAGSGTISIFDLIKGKGAMHFFIGNNSKPVDFQVGLDGDVFGADVAGTLGSYFNRNKDFCMKMNCEISYKIAGHKLGALPFEFDFILDKSKVTLKSKFRWVSHFYWRGHCVIHSGSKTKTKHIYFSSKGEFLEVFDTSFGNVIYESADPLGEYSVIVDSETQRLVIFAESSSGYPAYKVISPDNTEYSMSGGTLVIDVDPEDFEILPQDNQSEYTIDTKGFIVDSNEKTTVFIMENPQAGVYKVVPDAEFTNDIVVSVDIVPKMTVLSSIELPEQEFSIEESSDKTAEISFKSQDTKTGSIVGIYAKPSLHRNLAYDYWHEEYFKWKKDLIFYR